MAQKSFTNPCVLFDLPCRLPSGLCVGKPYWEGKLFEARDRHHADAFPCAYLEYVNKRLPRQVAEELGIRRMSPQAVGGAVGHNPISILIPCHRVVGTNGSLTGYAGGLDRKVKLLTLEKAEVGSLFLPKRGTAL